MNASFTLPTNQARQLETPAREVTASHLRKACINGSLRRPAVVKLWAGHTIAWILRETERANSGREKRGKSCSSSVRATYSHKIRQTQARFFFLYLSENPPSRTLGA